MNKINFLYLIFLLSIIIMVYTFFKIWRKDDFKGWKKSTLLYITIIIPVLGLFLVYNDEKK